jgi:hypothetical protein
LARKQLLWCFEFEDDVQFLPRVHILDDKLLSIAENLPVNKEETGILGPSVLAIIQKGPRLVEGLPSLDLVAVVKGLFHELHLVLLLYWLWDFLNRLSSWL